MTRSHHLMGSCQDTKKTGFPSVTYHCKEILSVLLTGKQSFYSQRNFKALRAGILDNLRTGTCIIRECILSGGVMYYKEAHRRFKTA